MNFVLGEAAREMEPIQAGHDGDYRRCIAVCPRVPGLRFHAFRRPDLLLSSHSFSVGDGGLRAGGRTGALRKRRSWMLISAGFLLWAVANCFAAYTDVIAHGPSTVASWDDFFFFFSGVPFLLAISSPEDKRRILVFFWLDVVQAAAVGCLTYMAVFRDFAVYAGERAADFRGKMVWLFGIEAVTLAVLCLARWVASPAGTRERGSFVMLGGLPLRDGDFSVHL